MQELADAQLKVTKFKKKFVQVFQDVPIDPNARNRMLFTICIIRKRTVSATTTTKDWFSSAGLAHGSDPRVQPSEDDQVLNDAARNSRKRARRSGDETVKTFSIMFPNLETLNWISELVGFIGPMLWQDTRLGEAQHKVAKARKRLTNGHNDTRDILLVVFPILLTAVLLSWPSNSTTKNDFSSVMA